MILHAQLEIWKAAYSDEDLVMNWRPETTPSTASSEDVSDGEFQMISNRENIRIKNRFLSCKDQDLMFSDSQARAI